MASHRNVSICGHVGTSPSKKMRLQMTLILLVFIGLSANILFQLVLCAPQNGLPSSAIGFKQEESKFYRYLHLTPNEVFDVTQLTKSWNFDSARAYLEKKISQLSTEEVTKATRLLEAIFPPPSLSAILSHLTAKQREKLKQLANADDPNVFTAKVNELLEKLPVSEQSKARVFVLNMIFDGYGGRKCCII
ncbi:hypothetical protein Tcan_06571 [Toxocara canis]|uniref:Uncharacterized protein n=1 Tax=Toxocara canis TaxID=6265 RepID=A0A0B2V748_TOXCA|nr:hypothetical protein Tcan_06571 [Toxocara canis]